jgi:hypothetical protein
MKTQMIVLSSLMLSLSAFADKPFYLKGDVSFTSAEKEEHIRVLPKIEEVFSKCLKREVDNHDSLYKRFGFSLYYGDQSAYAKANRKEKIKLITDAATSNIHLKYPKNYNFARFVDDKMMKPTSCIGLTLSCMKEAFTDEEVNSQATWNKVSSFTRKNGQTGTSMQYALQQLGWSIAYYNTDPSLNKDRDIFEKSEKAAYKKTQRGDHGDHYSEILNRSRYYDFLVDDTTSLVNFGHEMPISFENVGMFVGVAHKGYHVFPGFKGTVVEGHSSMALSVRNTIERQVFDPSNPVKAPRGEYHSGSIAIPPQYKLMSVEEEQRLGMKRVETKKKKTTKNKKSKTKKRKRGFFGRLLGN